MIQIKDIEFGYRSKNILHNISFDMNEGHCIAILGVNGAGKSTLIKCLNRINPVHKGAVMIENSNILQIHLNEVAKKIAYVAQKNEVSKLTVYDAILLGRKPYIKWDVTKKDKEIVDQVIEQLELQDYKMRFLDELSGGELQKVIVARALAQIVIIRRTYLCFGPKKSVRNVVFGATDCTAASDCRCNCHT